jgi:hypothetical protein
MSIPVTATSLPASRSSCSFWSSIGRSRANTSTLARCAGSVRADWHTTFDRGVLPAPGKRSRCLGRSNELKR